MKRSAPLKRSPMRRNGRSARKQMDDNALAVLRPLVLERDNYTCQGPARGVPIADHSLELQIHHILPRGRGGHSRDPDLLVTLCRECHAWVESHRARAYELGLLERSAS